MCKHPELRTELLNLWDLMLTEEAVCDKNVDEEGRNILHTIIHGVLFRSDGSKVFPADNTLLKQLLKRLVDKHHSLCNSTDSQGQTPLCFAINNCLQASMWLKKHDDKIIKQTFSLMTAIASVLAPLTNLDIQMTNGSTALLSLFNNLNIFDFNEIIQQDCFKELIELVSLLLTQQNINMNDDDNVTPYSWILLWQGNLEASLDRMPTNQMSKTKEMFQEFHNLFLQKNPDIDGASAGQTFLRNSFTRWV